MSIFSPSLPTDSGDRRFWGNLTGSARALAIYHAALKHQGFVLVLTQDTAESLQLEQELGFYDSQQSLNILPFPDWETLPYDSFSPHQDIISQRLKTLSELPRTSQGILIVPVSTLFHRLAPKSYLAHSGLMLKTGQRLDPEKFRNQLVDSGYRATDTVYEHGEFAVRGAILDVFPMGSQWPYRIELFDDEVETIRTFDPETQRSVDKMDAISLLPAHEFPLDKDAIRGFRDRWYENFPNAPRDNPVFQDVSQGIAPPGIEYYLPLFFEETATLFQYLPDDTLVLTGAQLQQAGEHFWRDVQSRYEERRHDIRNPILPPPSLFLRVEEVFQALKNYPRVELSRENLPQQAATENLAIQQLPDIAVDSRLADPLIRLKTFQNESGKRILVCADTSGRREVLRDLFREYRLTLEDSANWDDFLQGDAPYMVTVAALEEGFALNEPNIALVTEPQLFGTKVLQRRRRSSRKHDSTAQIINNLSEVRIGSPVVHQDHGVGRYQGLQTIEVDGQKAEFLTLQYADGAKLYVPVSNLHMISRYSGLDEELAPLHKLGSDKWSQAKQKAAEKIRDTAAELLDIYARRDAEKGYAYPSPDEAYRAFSEGFPFEETPDQQAAIDAVIRDMTGEKPMDRLVCGDVGFGKTEVAMRAAFLATQGGKQVVVLVPTTLLAQQHYQSFQDRFADTPVQVELISRFRSGKETNAILDKLERGAADIVIGTHKLLQKDIKFKNLGLLIIDEEHRFGVQQKERLKALRAQVDILTMTATPIPRTLNMAMNGIRDLSIIATPPARRLSVKTFVRRKEKGLVKEALLREILRGGQVYYLYNEVKSIDKAAEELQQLIPEARVGVAHGQMRERELERVMSDFYHKRFNVLVCSTIIETGIDVPSANTIVIERADKFGLAQLHQLRGRVGRSHHQAYAYLLTPEEGSITPDAEKRLEAIAASQDLGAGFVLASHDLEIRGAGELLGEEQSGHIHAIGFALYLEMLEEAVKAIREGRSPDLSKPLHSSTEIELRIPALIPDDYLPDVHNRLILYKRIANAKSDEEIREIQVEMIDRFGLLPDPVKFLLRQTHLKLKAQALGISKITMGPQSGRIEFMQDTQVDPYTLIKLIQSQANRFKLENGTQLKFNHNAVQADERLAQVEEILKLLAPAPSQQPQKAPA